MIKKILLYLSLFCITANVAAMRIRDVSESFPKSRYSAVTAGDYMFHLIDHEQKKVIFIRTNPIKIENSTTDLEIDNNSSNEENPVITISSKNDNTSFIKKNRVTIDISLEKVTQTQKVDVNINNVKKGFFSRAFDWIKNNKMKTALIGLSVGAILYKTVASQYPRTIEKCAEAFLPNTYFDVTDGGASQQFISRYI